MIFDERRASCGDLTHWGGDECFSNTALSLLLFGYRIVHGYIYCGVFSRLA